MLKETGSTEQISSEIKVLRRQVVELRVIEQRCQQAEAALKSFEERNRLLADSAPLGIFTTDTQEGVTGISRKMLEMLPWASVDDPKSMNLSDCQAMIESGILADFQRCIYVLGQNHEVRLKASFGVATWPQHAVDSKGLIAAADQALFVIKKTGKDAVGQFQSQ